jgi:hypothetical protein
MQTWYYCSRPSHLVFHDLTAYLKPPPNLRSLLGLGLKIILHPFRSHSSLSLTEDNDRTFPQFYRDLQLRCYFASGANPEDDAPADDNQDYNPYVRSYWDPPLWAIPLRLENRYRSFQQLILKVFTIRRGKPNLLPHQRATLEWLRSQDQCIVINCVKHLGTAIIKKRRYCALVHRRLTDTGVYNTSDSPKLNR